MAAIGRGLLWLVALPLTVASGVLSIALIVAPVLILVWVFVPECAPWNQRPVAPEPSGPNAQLVSASPQVLRTQTPVPAVTPSATPPASALPVVEYAAKCATWWERARTLTASGTATYGQLVDHLGEVLATMRAARPPTELAESHRALTDLYAVLWAWAQGQDGAAAFTREAQASPETYVQMTEAQARLNEAVGRLPVAVFSELVAGDCMGPNAQVTW